MQPLQNPPFYVVAPFIADHDCAEKAVSMKENTQTFIKSTLKKTRKQTI
jgi:hypothetical protein